MKGHLGGLLGMGYVGTHHWLKLNKFGRYLTALSRPKHQIAK